MLIPNMDNARLINTLLNQFLWRNATACIERRYPVELFYCLASMFDMQELFFPHMDTNFHSSVPSKLASGGKGL